MPSELCTGRDGLLTLSCTTLTSQFSVPLCWVGQDRADTCCVILAEHGSSVHEQAVKEEHFLAREALPAVGSHLAAAWEQGAEGIVPQAQVAPMSFPTLCRSAAV